MAHTEIKIRPFWYSDIWLFPKLITIITTLDKDGRINAAPYSHIMQYDVMTKNPRMIVGFRQDSHTYVNIKETGEFVINCPSMDYLEDVMETARFWPAGMNELDHTRFTQVPSKYVKPPTLAECPQVAECTVDEVVDLKGSSGIVIGNIKAILVHEGLNEIKREERIPAMNLPIGLGDAMRRYYYFCDTKNTVMHELADPPSAYRGRKAKTTMDWEDLAEAELMKVPPPVRPLVATNTEEYCREHGDDTVTLARFQELAREMGMTEELMDRFRSGG